MSPARDEEPAAVPGITHADMTEAVDDAQMIEDVVRIDEIADEGIGADHRPSVLNQAGTGKYGVQTHPQLRR